LAAVTCGDGAKGQRKPWEKEVKTMFLLTWMRKYKGFTLVEVLIVAAVIIILAGISIPQFLSFLERSRVDAAKAEIETMGSAIREVKKDTGHYIDKLDDLDDPTSPSSSFSPWWGPYVSSLPQDNKDPWGNGYFYLYWIEGSIYLGEWVWDHWPPGWSHGKKVGFVDPGDGDSGEDGDDDDDGDEDDGDDGGWRMPQGLYRRIQRMMQEQSYEAGFTLGSTGPDGEVGTDDDIVYGVY
jgi:general secretion pathway protein G